MPELVSRDELPRRSRGPGRGKSARQRAIDEVFAKAEQDIRDLIDGPDDGTVIRFHEFHKDTHPAHEITSTTLQALKDQCRSAVRKGLDEIDPDLRDGLEIQYWFDDYIERVPGGEVKLTGFDAFLLKPREE